MRNPSVKGKELLPNMQNSCLTVTYSVKSISSRNDVKVVCTRGRAWTLSS